MDLHLKGKRALVTGGSRGIGLACARQLAREGCAVMLAARDAEALQTAARSIAEETGATALTCVVDTASDVSVRAMIEAARVGLGGVDILVNAAAKVAGQSAPPKLAEITDALFWDDVNVKVMGYLRCARDVAPLMAAQGGGRIINISGLAARQTGSAIGSIRNVGVAALTKNIADELGPKGITAVTVHPGLTRTEKTAPLVASRAAASGQAPEAIEAAMASSVVLGRLVTAEEVADLVAFLASPRSVCINGDAIACGGGARGAIHY
jgi:NAD(P)-dependent dehydrogenase (short-subunit alcohol dehydrogenase family)